MKMTYIYALIDPRDASYHYIGKTVQNPLRKRLKQHLRTPATDELASWFEELGENNLSPDIKLLESVTPDGDWRASEIYWIRHGLAQGWHLKNKASGGDNYPLEVLAHAEDDDVVARVIYAQEDTLSLLTSINCYVMRGKRAEDNTFRNLFHRALLLVNAENISEPDYDRLQEDFCDYILTHGIIQLGRGWRVPLIKKKNPVGGEFLTVGKPFTINGISIAGQWDKSGWRMSVKMYKKTSDLLDTLATAYESQQRRGYDDVLRCAVLSIASAFDHVMRI
ncbi:MAG: hypothetical protein AAF846_21695 [Chloroflexota bacterium]